MRYYNRLVTDKNKCTVYLYGAIGDSSGTVSSEEIVTELSEADKTGKPIEVRINSNGGEVYAGIAIFNALRNCEGTVSIYVDGVAASIASIIALCGKPVKMSAHARLMLHRVSGTCCGTAEEMRVCIEEMEGLEDTLCLIYAARCKKSPEEIRREYFDGKDHWITAQQAVTLGFVDGISDTNNLKNFVSENEDEDGSNFALKSELCNLLGLSTDSTEETIYRAVKHLVRAGKFKDTQKRIENAIINGWIENGQKVMFTALAKSNKAAFESFIEERQQKDRQRAAEILNGAVSVGRLLPSERALYKKVGDAMGAKMLTELLDVKPYPKRAAHMISLYARDKKDWSLDDWRTYAPDELAKNPLLYEKLRKDNGKGGETSLDWYRRYNPDFLKENPEIYKQLVEQEFNNK